MNHEPWTNQLADLVCVLSLGKYKSLYKKLRWRDIFVAWVPGDFDQKSMMMQ